MKSRGWGGPTLDQRCFLPPTFLRSARSIQRLVSAIDNCKGLEYSDQNKDNNEFKVRSECSSSDRKNVAGEIRIILDQAGLKHPQPHSVAQVNPDWRNDSSGPTDRRPKKVIGRWKLGSCKLTSPKCRWLAVARSWLTVSYLLENNFDCCHFLSLAFLPFFILSPSYLSYLPSHASRLAEHWFIYSYTLSLHA